jgi:hypothetical protein
MNGGPKDFLSWVIEAPNDMRPGTLADWLEGRLPRPVDDLDAWSDSNDQKASRDDAADDGASTLSKSMMVSSVPSSPGPSGESPRRRPVSPSLTLSLALSPPWSRSGRRTQPRHPAFTRPAPCTLQHVVRSTPPPVPNYLAPPLPPLEHSEVQRRERRPSPSPRRTHLAGAFLEDRAVAAALRSASVRAPLGTPLRWGAPEVVASTPERPGR